MLARMNACSVTKLIPGEFFRAAGEYGMDFQYAVCPKKESVIGRIKSYFEVKGIPLWNIPIRDENAQGFFFPAVESDVVIDAEPYEQVVNDVDVWRAIMREQHDDDVFFECIGQAFE